METYVLFFIKNTWYSLNVNNFDDYENSLRINRNNRFVTFQTSDLIREIKSNHKDMQSPPTIIDFESFDKQMSQEGKEFRKYKEWKIMKALKYHEVINSEFRIKEDDFKPFLECLAALYLKHIENDKKETTRLEEVELKVNNIIYERQFKGIRIDSNKAKQRCKELEKEIYDIKNTLQFDYRVFTPENEKFQLHYLKNKNYYIIQSYLYTFKSRRNEDDICNLLYQLLRNKKDLDSLLLILSHWGGARRTYPSYLGFGTITSRIILRQPSLQNLRKTNRNIVVPDDEMKFLYVDYSQFEAGILASLSKDDSLINLYGKDIYSDLAKKVLGSEQKRSDAKVIFYRYMYGDKTLDEKAKIYFKQFEKLEVFRKKIKKEITHRGKIGTLKANYRCSNSENGSWSLSHVIQATASLIYKNALIRVNEEIKKAEFLIPMHDATLYQISKNEFDECRNKIKRIYEEEFKKVCPEIKAKVKLNESFA